MAPRVKHRHVLTKRALLDGIELLQTFDAMLMRLHEKPRRRSVRSSITLLERGRKALEKKIAAAWMTKSQLF